MGEGWHYWNVDDVTADVNRVMEIEESRLGADISSKDVERPQEC